MAAFFKVSTLSQRTQTETRDSCPRHKPNRKKTGEIISEQLMKGYV